MVTINTIDDLLRIVRENEEYRVALRRELLTDDLLALPSQIAEILQTQNELRETQNKILAEQERSRQTENRVLAHIDDLRETQNELRETQNKILAEQERSRETQSDMREIQVEMLKTQNQILRRLDNVEAHNRRLSDDFGAFRGNYAETAARKHAPAIALRLDDARSLGIDLITLKVLSLENILSLAREYGTKRLASIPKGEMESFYLSDLIIEVAKIDGSTCYIAVEASYTCNGRDTARALSHADLITRFTGKEAWPVIAGVRMDRQVQSLVDNNQVFWYQLEYEELEPD